MGCSLPINLILSVVNQKKKRGLAWKKHKKTAMQLNSQNWIIQPHFLKSPLYKSVYQHLVGFSQYGNCFSWRLSCRKTQNHTSFFIQTHHLNSNSIHDSCHLAELDSFVAISTARRHYVVLERKPGISIFNTGIWGKAKGVCYFCVHSSERMQLFCCVTMLALFVLCLHR